MSGWGEGEGVCLRAVDVDRLIVQLVEEDHLDEVVPIARVARREM